MWQLDNRTPFAAERSWVRDKNGAEVWLVAVKATFNIAPDGTTHIAPEQPPVLRLAEHHGDPATTSVKYDADLVLTKTTTDVIVVGHAHAPGGKSVTELNVGFKVGELTKVLTVTGDRRWEGSLLLGASDPEPFTQMPLVYERAYGGKDLKSDTPEQDWEWRNPVGRGFATSGANVKGLWLPNITHPKRPVKSWRDRPEPVGFGAVASHWQPRVGLAGTYDEQWLKTRQPLLAEDMDDRYYQCAPHDQQTKNFLRGGEPVVLANLSPLGLLQFDLPKLYFGFETRFYDGTRQRHTQRKLHTVILEPDFPRVSIVWHSALPCHFKVQKLERTLITLKTNLSTGEAAMDDSELELA
jgi:hypothetical protein